MVQTHVTYVESELAGGPGLHRAEFALLMLANERGPKVSHTRMPENKHQLHSNFKQFVCDERQKKCMFVAPNSIVSP